MKIEKIPTDKLIPYARNAKRHDAAQVSKLAGSIKEFGFNNPVLIDKDNGIIAGHGRVLAAQQLGLAEVPCIRLGHLTDNQRRAYILADNRLAEINSGWDEELLKLEVSDIDWGDIKGLSVDDFEFGEIEFGEDEKEGEKSDIDAEPQIDKAEELRAKWGVEPGQLWELGDHRLLCGDSTKKEDVERVMGGDKPCASWADPPFEKDYKSRGAKGDCVKSESWQTILKATADNRCPAWFVKIPWTALCESIEKLNPNHLIVWAKQGFGMGGRDFRPQHEMICYGRNGGKCNAGADVGDVWTFPVPFRGRMLHVAETPVALISKAVGYVTDAGDVVFDPFSGSGTTIIACEQLGRKCRAIEISPAYVAVALQRWADATGKTPRKL